MLLSKKPIRVHDCETSTGPTAALRPWHTEQLFTGNSEAKVQPLQTQGTPIKLGNTRNILAGNSYPPPRKNIYN